jgi:hypothetical protein
MAALRSTAEIRAAGAAAVAGWRLTAAQVEQVVGILLPVRDQISQPDQPDPATSRGRAA